MLTYVCMQVDVLSRSISDRSVTPELDFATLSTKSGTQSRFVASAKEHTVYPPPKEQRISDEFLLEELVNTKASIEELTRQRP